MVIDIPKLLANDRKIEKKTKTSDLELIKTMQTWSEFKNDQSPRGPFPKFQSYPRMIEQGLGFLYHHTARETRGSGDVRNYQTPRNRPMSFSGGRIKWESYTERIYDRQGRSSMLKWEDREAEGQRDKTCVMFAPAVAVSFRSFFLSFFFFLGRRKFCKIIIK